MRKRALAVVLATIVVSLGNTAAATDGGRAPQLNQTPTPTPQAGNGLVRLVLTLALAEVQPFKSGEFLPGAAKAVADLKDFLPYKSYRPLDTIFMIGFGTPNHPVQGLEGRPYELRVRGTASLTVANISLQLMDPKLLTPNSSPWLIDTSFKLEIGETIVVGTSRLDGNRALLVLVTWVK